MDASFDNRPAGSRRAASRAPVRRAAHAGVAMLLAVLIGACGGGSGDSSGVDIDPDIDAGPDIDTGPDTDTGPDITTGPDIDIDFGEGPDGPEVPDDGADCSVAAQNAWAYESMQDYYLFYDQVPTVDPADFASADELVRAVRFEERDRFSFVSGAETATLEFEAGREFGLGYNWGEFEDGTARVTRVIEDGPFGRAGIERGDIIAEVGGRPAIEALTDAAFFETELLGTPDAPGEASWRFLDRDTGESIERMIAATEYAIDTVRHVDVFTNESYDGSVGYFALSRFLETSSAEIETAFDRFREDGITDLVLDLRYNLGGRISVAQQLSSLVVGDAQAGALLQRYQYNDKYAASENFDLPIIGGIGGLDLRSLVVLTHPSTASASEIVINGLQPLMDVQVVGTFPTAGKPYIQLGRDRCGERLNAVEAEAVNSVGESVFGGIRPDCASADNWDEAFGVNESTGEIETMLLAGLDLVVFGECEPYVDPLAKRAGSSLEPASGQGSRASGGAIR